MCRVNLGFEITRDGGNDSSGLLRDRKVKCQIMLRITVVSIDRKKKNFVKLARKLHLYHKLQVEIVTNAFLYICFDQINISYARFRV